MAISIQSAKVVKNTDGTYSVAVLHVNGAVSNVNFTHVPFAEEMATAYAAFLNGYVKVANAVEGAASTVRTDAGADAVKALEEAKTLVTNAKAEGDKLITDAKAEATKVKAEAETLLADAKAEVAKLIADAKAEVAKLKGATPEAPVVIPPAAKTVTPAPAPAPAAAPAANEADE